jgi:formylglycine-generating enzyme required for sulfatase activity
MADVFLSYKRADRARVEPVVALLERAGLSVWWDSTLVAGERFDQVIQQEIEQAGCVVVAWSVHSVDAIWVRDEAGRGRDRGVLVPFSLDGARPPIGFGLFQTPDLSGWTGDPDDPVVRDIVAGATRTVRGGPATLPPTQQARPAASPTRLTRRRLLRLGASAGGLGIATAAGVWVGGPQLLRSARPATRLEGFDVVAVTGNGALHTPQRGSATTFDIPVGRTTLQFSVIPAGEFPIGSPDTEPQRRPNEGPQVFVRMREFALSCTTVTQAVWAALVDAAPDSITQTLPPSPAFFRGDELPVETVNWHAAVEFCDRLSALSGMRCRLPSESEWEYACRAGSSSAFHFGPTVTPELANYCGTGGAVRGVDNGRDISGVTYDGASYETGAYGDGPPGGFIGRTMKVRSYPPNRFGLYEMHGNVWEYCQDTARVGYDQLPTDGSAHVGPGELRILRGGSWSHHPALCRSAYREQMSADFAGWQGRVGLRVACDLPG